MKVHNLTNFDRTNGTSFHNDIIYASANEICEKLDVDITCYAGDKTNFEFELETEDGTPFTIYDWKEGDWINEDTILYYHIGARTAEESHKVLAVLKEHGLKTQMMDTSNISVDVAQLMRFLGQ